MGCSICKNVVSIKKIKVKIFFLFFVFAFLHFLTIVKSNKIYTINSEEILIL